jgi:hypothetical protein
MARPGIDVCWLLHLVVLVNLFQWTYKLFSACFANQFGGFFTFCVASACEYDLCSSSTEGDNFVKLSFGTLRER